MPRPTWRRRSGVPAALVATLLLAASSGGRSLRGLRGAAGVAVTGAALAGKLWAVAQLPEGGRTIALVLAGMLGRWAVVVQCYGGTPARTSGPVSPLIGRARLREFGWASTVAFASTFAVLDAIGLAVVFAATLVTVALRVLAYRRSGGVSDTMLGASVELVETTALLVLAGSPATDGQAGRRGTSTRRRSDSTTSPRWLRARVST